MFGVKESEGAKWFQSGQKEFKEGLKEIKLVQVELELVEGSKITSKCVKIKMKADKLEFTQGIFLRDICHCVLVILGSLLAVLARR